MSKLTKVYTHTYPSEQYNVDTMPNGELNRCTAITRKGRQCRNAVIQGMIGHETWEVVGYAEGHPAYRSLVELTDDEYDTMTTGLCYIHLAV